MSLGVYVIGAPNPIGESWAYYREITKVSIGFRFSLILFRSLVFMSVSSVKP